jgi:hypothetical protein
MPFSHRRSTSREAGHSLRQLDARRWTSQRDVVSVDYLPPVHGKQRSDDRGVLRRVVAFGRAIRRIEDPQPAVVAAGAGMRMHSTLSTRRISMWREENVVRSLRHSAGDNLPRCVVENKVPAFKHPRFDLPPTRQKERSVGSNDPEEALIGDVRSYSDIRRPRLDRRKL